MELHKSTHDNFIGDIIGQVGSTACFGDKACQEKRDISIERQRLENQMLQKELSGSGSSSSDEGMSTGTMLLIVFMVFLFLGGVIFFVIKRRKK